MLPVVGGLALAIPLAATSRAAIGEKLRNLGLLLTPDEASPPTILPRANTLAETDPTPVREPFSALLEDPVLRGAHLDMLQPIAERAIGDVDIPLVVALAKIDQAQTFEQAVALLSREESFAVLAHPAALQRLLRLPRR